MWHRKSHARLDFSSPETMRGLSSGLIGQVRHQKKHARPQFWTQGVTKTLALSHVASKMPCAAPRFLFYHAQPRRRESPAIDVRSRQYLEYSIAFYTTLLYS